MPDDPRDEPPSDGPAEPVPSSWAARHSMLPGDEEPEREANEARSRSIFNRFRRTRQQSEELQTRLALPDEPPAFDLDDLPALEPARSPWRRPAIEDESQPLTPATPPPFRPTPPPVDAVSPAEMVEVVEEAEEASAVAAIETVALEAAPAAQPPASAVVEPPVPAPALEPEAFAPPLAPDDEPPPALAVPEAPASLPGSPAAVAPSTPPPPPLPLEQDATDEPEELEVIAAIEVPAPPPRPWLAPAPSAPAEAGTPPEPVVAAEETRGRAWPAFRPIPGPVNPYMLLLTGLATLATMSYLLVEPSPRWTLILGAAAVAAGMDGTLRATWRVTYRDADTTPALFMPAIYILAVPPLIEHNVRGLGVIPAGLAACLVFFLIVAAQVGSARPGASYYPWARTVSTAGAYAAGFAFFSLTYVYDLGITVSALATALVALMLAVEVLREGEIDPMETMGYAAAAGAATGQWRLALHYLPVDGYLAGLAVLLGFLVVTGLLQAYITRSLDRRVSIDHAAIALAGAALVIGARMAGLA